MEYTLKQLADLTGVTKQTCWRYVKKHNIEPIKKLDNGAQVYPEEALQQLQKEYNSNTTDKKDYNNSSVIEVLQQQLAVKDDQIKELHRLLDQQQQLNLNTSHLLEDKRHESHTEPQDHKADNKTDNYSTETQKKSTDSTEENHIDDKKGFFSRLFRK
ncbi:MAG TPA: hypothetical protein DDW47_03110 [Lactobacillus acetotolerans]|jgi:DNA-binding transcriptional MerR regulator|nr:hypothetical protein [Lactobacillus acetotolerans]